MRKVLTITEDVQTETEAAAAKLYIREIPDLMNSWTNNSKLKYFAFKTIHDDDDELFLWYG